MPQRWNTIQNSTKRNVTRETLYPTEYQECECYYAWTQLQPALQGMVIKHVNEGKRHPIAGKRLKAIGMQRGLPDYQIIIPTPKYPGMWIEMKTRDRLSRKKDPYQDAFLEKLRKQGYFAEYTYGFEHAIQLTLAYINSKL